MRWFAAAVVVAGFASGSALAFPPPEGSEQYQILTPYGHSIEKLNVPGSAMSCCSISDCRLPDGFRQTSDREHPYEVQITRSAFGDYEVPPDVDGKWLKVGAENIISPAAKRDLNLPEFPIVCWSAVRYHMGVSNGFYCVWPGSET